MAKLLNWYLFQKKLNEKKIALFTPLDIRRVFGVTKVAAAFFLYRYTKKGLILRLKRGLYMLADSHVPDLYLANKLYEPSYISLEFGLSYHRVIPETVYQITSVTSKATRRFTVGGKIFSYNSIKKEAFTGYQTQVSGNFSFIIADPEKAFVDLNYFRLIKKQKPLSRFDKEKINSAKALRYAKLFNNKKLISIIKTTLQ